MTENSIKGKELIILARTLHAFDEYINIMKDILTTYDNTVLIEAKRIDGSTLFRLPACDTDLRINLSQLSYLDLDEDAVYYTRLSKDNFEIYNEKESYLLGLSNAPVGRKIPVLSSIADKTPVEASISQADLRRFMMTCNNYVPDSSCIRFHTDPLGGIIMSNSDKKYNFHLNGIFTGGKHSSIIYHRFLFRLAGVMSGEVKISFGTNYPVRFEWTNCGYSYLAYIVPIPGGRLE